MKYKRRTEIQVDLEETVSIRSQQVFEAWCGECRKSVRMVSPEVAGWMSSRTVREIYRLLEAGAVHFVEDPRGSIYICCLSLQAQLGLSNLRRR